jgi:hypothetical protein
MRKRLILGLFWQRGEGGNNYFIPFAFQDKKCGEMVIQSPELDALVEQDLHMVPGLLRLGTKQLAC